MSTTTRLVLRADSGAAIGVGHVARCVGFAEQARARGWWVGFAGTVAGHFADALDSLGVQRIAVDRLLDCAADVVLIDNYSVGDVRADVHASGALLVSVEDGRFGRRPADVVVDCGLVRHARPDDGSTLVLAGCEYAPLRARVRVARDVRRARPVDGEPLDVLVVLGGTPAVDVLDAVLTAVLTAVRQAGVRARVRAFSTAETVVAQRFPHVTVQ
ncbi:MAG: spore coat protein, partial [Sciscionella sp.]|nr:spore coat protein [Sciscionella sp.]